MLIFGKSLVRNFLNMKRKIKKKKEIKISKQDNFPGYSLQVIQML